LKIKLEQVSQTEKDLQAVFEKQRKELHQMTGLSKEAATERLLKLLEDELQDEVGGRILQHEKKMQDICEEKSREILMMTTQRFAASHTSDHTTSTIDIPNDEMKGRIIGREGRNIRSFEKETGVDVIIDDTPGVVIVSGFDPVRREVARIALNKLIHDGRIHPTRIEEVVGETQKEMDEFIRRIHLESILVSACMTGGFTFMWGLYTNAGLPMLDSALVLPIMMAFWGIATFFRKRAYE